MTASGTYNYGPSVGELVIAGFRRCQIGRSEITSEHLADAKNETNLLQVEWANKGPLLWTVDVQSVPLIQGQITYSIPEPTVMILDAYISIPNGDGTTSDRIITPLSRTEYASMPEKSQQGSPTSFWFDRLIAASIYMWPAPDENGPYTLNYYRFSQIQDAVFSNATTPQITYLWLDAYVAGLSHRLARIYAPALESVRATDAKTAYDIASTQGTENVAVAVNPNTSSYYR